MAEKKEEGRPEVSSETLARLCNLTTRRIEQLAKDGVMVRRSRGKYDLWGSVASYIRFLQDKEVNQWGGNTPDMNEVRKRKLELECKRISFALEVEKGKYVSRDAVKDEGIAVGAILKGSWMRLENDLPPMVEGLTAQKMKPIMRAYARSELLEIGKALEAATEIGEEYEEEDDSDGVS